MATSLGLFTELVARLKTGAPKFVTYDEGVPDNPGQAYLVPYPTPGQALGRGYTQLPLDFRWQCNLICVGRNVGQALNTADLARTLVVGYRLTGCTPFREVPINAPVLPETVLAGDVRQSITLLISTTTTRG